MPEHPELPARGRPGDRTPGQGQFPAHLRQQMQQKMQQLQAEARKSAESLRQSFGKNLDPQHATDMLRKFVKHEADRAFADVEPGVGRMGIVFVNVYALSAGGGKWFLVDTGLPGFAPLIRAACEARFDGRPPEGIILTHAHFDHASGVEQLAGEWDVPVYAHRLEMPYLTGQSDYPPQDPTPGGAICFLSRFFPHSGFDLRDKVELRELPEEGEEAHTVPGLAGWRWLHTPGHTPGHVSLFREFDKFLLAGDAVATMDMDSWASQFSRKRELARPPVPFTPDWRSAHESVDKLAALEPKIVAAGHGLPMSGRYVAGELADLAERMQPPRGGRYTGVPAHYDAVGRVQDLPPPPPDPLKPKLTVAAVVAMAGLGLALFAATRRRR